MSGRHKVKDATKERSKMSEPSRVLIGKQNKENGAYFEQLIMYSCEQYQKRGICVIEKTPEPFHIIGKSKNIVHGYYEAKGQPDFKGALCDGSCIIFEAKHTSNDKIKQNVITPLQWETLDFYESMQAHCFVMISLALSDFFRVPWKEFKQMKERFGHKYMSKEELQPYILTKNGLFLHILDGIKLRE